MLYILGLINSKAVNRWFSSTYQESLHIKINQLQEIPLPDSTVDERRIISDLVKNTLKVNKELNGISEKFQKYFTTKFSFTTVSNRLLKWYDLSFASFITEINKAVKTTSGTTLSKKDEIEWMDLFEDYKGQAQTLKAQIESVDREIDGMVYELYGLSGEEIGIVENS